MTGNYHLIDYTDPVNEKGTVFQGYLLEFNSYRVTIYKLERGTGRNTGEVVYRRGPSQDEWLDDSHKKLINAIQTMENAVESVLELKGAVKA